MLVAGKGRVQLLVSQPCSSGRLHIQDHMDNTNSYGRVKKKRQDMTQSWVTREGEVDLGRVRGERKT